jgi:hypothetical protein
MPDSNNFPLLTPTYYPSEFAWFNAEVIYLQNNLSSADIRMIEIDSLMLGGFTINGNAVYNGTPKRLSFISAPNKTLILYNKSNSNKPIIKVKTKQDGSFTFKTDEPGEFGIHLDLPGVRIDTSYSILLSSSQTDLNNLYVIIDSTEIIFDIISNVEDITKNFTTDIKIYPNPNKGDIYVHSNNEEPFQIIIYDLSGAEILNKNIKSSDSIAIPEKYQGLLFVKMISAEKTFTKKIIVVR